MFTTKIILAIYKKISKENGGDNLITSIANKSVNLTITAESEKKVNCCNLN